MLVFSRKSKTAVNQKPLQYFAWVDDKSFKVGQRARILPLISVLLGPSEKGYLVKKQTGAVLAISDDKNSFETANTLYVRKEPPYLKAILKGNIPVLTEVLQEPEHSF